MIVLKAVEEDAKEQERKGDCIKILGIKEQNMETNISLSKAIVNIDELVGADVTKIDIKEV